MAKSRKAEKDLKSPFRARELFWRSVPVILLLQLLAFAIAATVVIVVVNIDFSKEFYSAHRSISSVRALLLPALLTGGAAGFLVVAVITVLSLRFFSRRLTGPVLRTDSMLKRLAQGDLTYNPAVLPNRQRWALDDSAEAMLAAFREKTTEVQQITKELQNSVLSLRYKSTGSDPLTLQELREITRTLEGLCKQLSSSIKWFET